MRDVPAGLGSPSLRRDRPPRLRAACCSSWLLVLAACGTTQGPLLWELDAGPSRVADSDASVSDAGSGGAPSLPPTSAAGAVSTTAPKPPVTSEPDAAMPSAPAPRVTPGMRLHYQISGTPAIDANAQVFVLDLFDSEAAQLSAARARGQIALAYFSAGSLEPWRPDAASFPRQAIGSALRNYPNESWLDIRSASVRALMQARLELARDKGFDGVFPGSLGAYRQDTGFPLSEADQLDFDRDLASRARALGLSPGLSGDFALAAQLESAFDWAIAFGCLAADSCGQLQPLLDRGKAVFDLEVEGDMVELCARAKDLGIVVSLKRSSYDAWSKVCTQP
jgi:hypothetical protein